MGIESFIKNQLNNREQRIQSPEFQRALAQEKLEFNKQLDRVGDSALDFVCTGLVKKGLGGSMDLMAKTLFKEKYGIDSFLKDSAKLGFQVGKRGVKTVGEILKTTGKAGKIGIRQLIGY